MTEFKLHIASDVIDKEYTVVEFIGELDQATRTTGEEQILEIVKSTNYPYLIFDFKKLKFINSDGIGFLVAVQAKLSKKNCTLLIAAPQAHVLDVSQAIGLPSIIPHFATVNEAILYIKKRS